VRHADRADSDRQPLRVLLPSLPEEEVTRRPRDPTGVEAVTTSHESHSGTPRPRTGARPGPPRRLSDDRTLGGGALRWEVRARAHSPPLVLPRPPRRESGRDHRPRPRYRVGLRPERIRGAPRRDASDQALASDLQRRAQAGQAVLLHQVHARGGAAAPARRRRRRRRRAVLRPLPRTRAGTRGDPRAVRSPRAPGLPRDDENALRRPARAVPARGLAPLLSW